MYNELILLIVLSIVLIAVPLAMTFSQHRNRRRKMDLYEKMIIEKGSDWVNLKLKRLREDAVVPKKATIGSACLDLVSITDLNIQRGKTAVIRTGIALEIPYGYVMLIFSRSGHGFRNGITLVNSTGVIDSDYRGEILIGLRNDGDTDFSVQKGERVAQAILLKYPYCSIEEVEELSRTRRGAGGFGSTNGM